MIILKATKNQGFTPSLEDTFLEKSQGGVKLPPPKAFSGLNRSATRESTCIYQFITINVYMRSLTIMFIIFWDF